MIEALMLAALGFLVATFGWLLVLPALSQRADRLARRRAELSFPLSIEEVAAERDHLRAELAVRQRELERRVEASQAARAEALSKAGQRDLTIAELKMTLGVRDVRIAQLEATLADTRATLSETRDTLAAEQQAHADTSRLLAVRGEALEERAREIAALEVVRTDLTIELDQTRRARDDATTRGDALAAERDRLSAELTGLISDHAALEAERTRLAGLLQASERLASDRAETIARLEQEGQALRERLDSEVAAHATTRAAFDQRGTDVAQLLADRDGLRQRLRAEEARTEALETAVKQANAAHEALALKHTAARKELDSLQGELRAAHADKARLDAQFASARTEHGVRLTALNADLVEARAQSQAIRSEKVALASEVAALKRAAEAARDTIERDNAALRREIVRIGDLMLQAPGLAPPSASLTLPTPPMSAPPRLAAGEAPAVRTTRAMRERAPTRGSGPDQAAE